MNLSIAFRSFLILASAIFTMTAAASDFATEKPPKPVTKGLVTADVRAAEEKRIGEANLAALKKVAAERAAIEAEIAKPVVVQAPPAKEPVEIAGKIKEPKEKKVRKPQEKQLPLFASQDVLEVKLTADLSAVMGVPYRFRGPKTFFPAKIEWVDAEGNLQAQELQIARRGALRGNDCTFSPLKFEFEKRPKAPSLFEGVNELKVVTHCGRAVVQQGDFDELVRQEFLMYQIQRELFPNLSFRTRHTRITYEDSSGKSPVVTHDAILIEDISDLARRLGVDRAYSTYQTQNMTKEQSDKIKPLVAEGFHQFGAKHLAEVRLFQAMISNTDYQWGHNTRAVKTGGVFEVIPYDFDYAYLFRGGMGGGRPYSEMQCLTNETNRSIVAKFENSREKIEAIIRNSNMISDVKKTIALSSLESFYKSLPNVKIDYGQTEDQPTCPAASRW